MANSKKPKSKPAAKKKAAKKATAHHPQSLPIAAIATLATRVSDVQSELKAANQKLNYVLVALAPRNREEWHPMVEEAERALENE
jgi:hypothetical protein